MNTWRSQTDLPNECVRRNGRGNANGQRATSTSHVGARFQWRGRWGAYLGHNRCGRPTTKDCMPNHILRHAFPRPVTYLGTMSASHEGNTRVCCSLLLSPGHHRRAVNHIDNSQHLSLSLTSSYTPSSPFPSLPLPPPGTLLPHLTMSDDSAPYAATHPHPDHIDIPPTATGTINDSTMAAVAVGADDEHTTLQPSGERPAPARGILKNPIRATSDGRADRCVPNPVALDLCI